MAAHWASLPADLINRVAGRLLAADDLDYYMDMRATCRAWRAATSDPRADPRDPRFRPRRWAALDEVHHDDERRLFVNAATGRFVRKHMPVLRRRYIAVAGAAGGMLVLAERSAPHAARVLNPFTGGVIRFEAPVPSSEMEVVARVVGSSPPTLVLLCGKSRKIYCADPEDKCFHFHELVRELHPNPLAWTAYLGAVYAAAREVDGEGGAPFASRLSAALHKVRLLLKRLFANHLSREDVGAVTDDFIVESDGETLLVLKLHRGMKVFKLDTIVDVVRPVKDLGDRALFVSNSRCLSVDASKFPSVAGNNIYNIVVENISTLDFGVCAYNLKNKREVTLHLGTPPLTVVQILSCHAFNVRASQLAREVMDAILAEQQKALGFLFRRD